MRSTLSLRRPGGQTHGEGRHKLALEGDGSKSQFLILAGTSASPARRLRLERGRREVLSFPLQYCNRYCTLHFTRGSKKAARRRLHVQAVGAEDWVQVRNRGVMRVCQRQYGTELNRKSNLGSPTTRSNKEFTLPACDLRIRLTAVCAPVTASSPR
jgi:hypothetical protein